MHLEYLSHRPRKGSLPPGGFEKLMAGFSKLGRKKIFVPNSKGTGKYFDYTINYLECCGVLEDLSDNKNKGSIITSQGKAWNDSVRFIMFIDLILLPYATAHSKLALWLDNCTMHVSKMVEIYLSENKEQYKHIYFLYYLPNMTHLLQVLDLVLNGPLKNTREDLQLSIYIISFEVFMQNCGTKVLIWPQ